MQCFVLIVQIKRQGRIVKSDIVAAIFVYTLATLFKLIIVPAFIRYPFFLFLSHCILHVLKHTSSLSELECLISRATRSYACPAYAFLELLKRSPHQLRGSIDERQPKLGLLYGWCPPSPLRKLSFRKRRFLQHLLLRTSDARMVREGRRVSAV